MSAKKKNPQPTKNVAPPESVITNYATYQVEAPKQKTAPFTVDFSFNEQTGSATFSFDFKGFVQKEKA